MKHLKKKTLLSWIFIFLCLNIATGVVIAANHNGEVSYSFNIKSDFSNSIQIFEGERVEDFKEENSFHYTGIVNGQLTKIDHKISTKTNYIRIDFVEYEESVTKLSNFEMYKGSNRKNIMSDISNEIDLKRCVVKQEGDSLIITASGEDPHIILKLNQGIIDGVLNNTTKTLFIKIAIGCLSVNLIFIGAMFLLRRNMFFKDMMKERRLIWSLSKNDFKTKYAGSFFGVIWAFIQPVVTIVLYWFVFQVGLRSGDVGEVPFVLWLMCGLVPWFFFQDALLAITNCLIEYSYLVKKMVFRIDILPFVKLISALFVHLFFIAFMITVFCLMGYYPTIYSIQLFYYMFCTIVFVIGLGYATSALVIFFKDLGQIIQIFLQIGMWMTPILWNIEMLPKSFLWLMELNPMYYIVSGFRDALVNQTWVWSRFDMTLNFWLITITLYVFGLFIFKKLKPHLADVL